MCPCLRYGIPGSVTDVSYVDGTEIINCVGISETGRVSDHGVGIDGKVFDLNVPDKQVPCWDHIVDQFALNIISDHRALLFISSLKGRLPAIILTKCLLF